MYTYFILGTDEKRRISFKLAAGADKESALRSVSKSLKYVLLTFKIIGVSQKRSVLNPGEIGTFFDRLHMLLHAGIPLCKALNIMENTSEKLSKYAKPIHEGVSRGDTLLKSMEMSDVRFPDMALKLVDSGENSGNIEFSCEKLSHYYNNIDRMKKEIINLSLYPIIVLIFSIIMFISMYVIILPRFSELVYLNGIEVKGWSSTILKSSVYVRSHVVELGIMVAVLLASAMGIVKSNIKREWIEKVILRFPQTRKVYKSFVGMAFSQTMGMSMGGGMNILEGVDACKGIFKGKEYLKALEIMEENIKRGECFSSGMAKSDIFSEELVAIVSIGESSGSLSKVFENMSKYYERALQSNVKRVLSVLGPLLIVAVSVVMGTMLYFVVMPIIGTLNNMV